MKTWHEHDSSRIIQQNSLPSPMSFFPLRISSEKIPVFLLFITPASQSYKNSLFGERGGFGSVLNPRVFFSKTEYIPL